MPGVKPVIELVNVPVPVPSVVWGSVIVGFAEILQQTPRAVTAAPPASVTFPPLDAVVEVILETALVVTVGATAIVIMVTSFP